MEHKILEILFKYIGSPEKALSARKELLDVSILLPSQKDINDAISAIRQTYEDLVSGDTYPIDEWSPVAKNLKYALRKLGNKC